MLNLFLKIFRTKSSIISLKEKDFEEVGIAEVGDKIAQNVKELFAGSLAIRQVDGGSDNACEQELVALSNAFYDIERFGIHFVASPRHADMLLVTGPITRNMTQAVKSAYEATPNPKIVVALGDDALDGGIFRDSYAISGGVGSVIPVNYYIPGDPPTSKFILCSLLKILETEKKRLLK